MSMNLSKKNQNMKQLIFIMIDENEEFELASKYDYYYVPTCYVNGRKVHEGSASKKDIQKVLDAALEK